MVDVLRCTGCQAGLRMRPEFAGKKLRCPRCGNQMSVPRIQADRPAVVPDDPPPLPNDTELTTTDPRPDAQPMESDLEAPRKKRRRIVQEEAEEEPVWQPCPSCGAEDPEKVHWTFWGSFYGPALFNHVKCLECGQTYNGVSGRSNFIPALIFVTIPVLLIMGLIGVITWLILSRQFS
jgi:predicted RNA-binding Zn-ribbon protein involved in translation (DUF1610 family)